MWVKNVTDFLKICYLNIPCLRIIIIIIIIMSSSSKEFTLCRKTQKQVFLLISGGHVVSIYVKLYCMNLN